MITQTERQAYELWSHAIAALSLEWSNSVNRLAPQFVETADPAERAAAIRTECTAWPKIDALARVVDPPATFGAAHNAVLAWTGAVAVLAAQVLNAEGGVESQLLAGIERIGQMMTAAGAEIAIAVAAAQDREGGRFQA